ncbi:MAG: hypothetical protein OEO21_11835 [Candidatus Krumholzibacteria bacterium]|nr:hypothetical protein [Candidatus Krumholzibacteria bacterium]
MKKVLSLVWRGWKKFAHVLGIVNTKILLTVSYFVIIALVSIISKILRADLIDRRLRPQPSYWHDREPLSANLDSCRRQF